MRSRKMDYACSNCGAPFHGVTACKTQPPMKSVSVSLPLDHWSVILKALEIAAEMKRKNCRDTAEAVLLETRMEVQRQVNVV